VSFSKEAREKFLSFALSPVAMWVGNFRDLNAAVARMATLAPSGRISTQVAVVADRMWRKRNDEPAFPASSTEVAHEDSLGMFKVPPV